MIEAVRDEIGIYLQDLELALFEKSRKAFAQAFRHVLKHLDIVIRDKRDPRFEAKERVGTTLKTLLGVQVSFKRRRYNDTVTGDSVYLLDEVLGMVEGTQTSPALAKLMLQLAMMMSYRDAEESLEQFYGYRPVCHETIRQVVLKTG
ncbi:MAG: hypothetical protein GX986_06930, partial [Firmicutes bacterium]|nr:hypothetical protein [Bacillota bacterium]